MDRSRIGRSAALLLHQFDQRARTGLGQYAPGDEAASPDQMARAYGPPGSSAPKTVAIGVAAGLAGGATAPGLTSLARRVATRLRAFR